MNTKEKLDKKLEKTGDRILGTLLTVKDFQDKEKRLEVSQELNIDIDTTEKLFKKMQVYQKDKKNLKMLSYLAKHSSNETSLYSDVAKAEKQVKSSQEDFHKLVNIAKYESFISEIDPEMVTKEVIEYLKDNKVDSYIGKKAIQKYASNVNSEQIKSDNTFKFLYENNYETANQNTSLDVAYKYYSESRKKDEDIRMLENKIVEKEDVIDGKNNAIRVLNLKVEYYEQTVPDIQSRIKAYAKKAQKSVYSVKELQKQAEEKEHFGFFSKAIFKIKSALKKDKPILLSTSLKGIQSEITNITTGLTEVGDSINQPTSQDSIINEVQKHRQMWNQN